MPRARLILADDHDLFREGVAGLINAQPDLEVAGAGRRRAGSADADARCET